MSQSELLVLGSKPIRPDAPAGSPGRDEPEFDLLQSEIRKLESPDGRQPDWAVVVSCSTTLLNEKSKDLLPACCLCVGLFEEQGYAGLSTGLSILRDLIAGYWDSLFPEIKRMRGRVAAFDWLAQRGAKIVEGRAPRPDEADAVAAAIERATEITTLLEPQMEDGFRLIQPLRHALEEAAASRLREEAPSSTPASPQGAASPAAEVRTPEAASRVTADLRDLAIKLADYLRVNEPGNPLGFRLPRMIGWMHLSALPPHTNGQTQIPAPQPSDMPVKLEEMMARGQWPAVLEQTESRFLTSILWLDLHYFAVRALEAMGEIGASPAQAICDELGLLLNRLRGLEELRFQNGQPLANERTRAWIAERIQTGAGPGAGASSEGGARGDAALSAPGSADEKDLADFDATRSEARSLWKGKRLPEGIRLLVDRAGAARSLRGRALWKLEAARLCMDAGQTEAAIIQLQILDDEMKRSTWDDWNPALCLEVLKSLWQCRQKISASSHSQPAAEIAREREILERLWRLDPSAAISLEGRH